MGRLEFNLILPSQRPGRDHFTTAELAVRIDNETVWPKPYADSVKIEIQIDDLLSYLIDNWSKLALGQTYPINAQPRRPSEFRSEVEKKWDDEYPEDAEKEDAVLCAFEEAHNLAQCFGGYFDVAQLWLLRSSDQMLVDSPAGLFEVSFIEAFDEFRRVGDLIVNHLSARSDKWGRLADLWRSREDSDGVALLALSTGLPRKIAERFVNDELLSLPRDLSDAANDNDEIRIAARMASALPEEEIARILKTARSFEKRTSPRLDALSQEVLGFISERFATSSVQEQGEAAADFIRSRSDFSSSQFFDIQAYLEGLGVALHPQNGFPETLDALAVWGERHGPAVLLNLNSFRARHGVNSGPARVTLAHELCHFLFDRGHALGVVDVLNSKMPLVREKRAKSFAGELLLPSSAACALWVQQGRPLVREELNKLLTDLAMVFGVSRSVAAWKLEHGARLQDVNLRAILNVIAPSR